MKNTDNLEIYDKVSINTLTVAALMLALVGGGKLW